LIRMSSVASIVIFAFKTRETGHPRLASRAAFSNVARSIRRNTPIDRQVNSSGGPFSVLLLQGEVIHDLVTQSRILKQTNSCFGHIALHRELMCSN
jgi:hypothetical protein